MEVELDEQTTKKSADRGGDAIKKTGSPFRGFSLLPGAGRSFFF
jgi:hypothetical protein